MTKRFNLLIISLLTTSCSTISYSQLPGLISDAVLGQKEIIVTPELYAESDFSFINARVNNKTSALLTLYSVNDGKLYWTSSSGEILITQSGKIIKTIGLLNDVSTISLNFEIRRDADNGFYYLQLFSPEAIVKVSQNLQYMGEEVISYLGVDTEVSVYKETNQISKLNRSYSNYYYLKDGKVIKSKQNTHVRNGYFVLDFYYK